MKGERMIEDVEQLRTDLTHAYADLADLKAKHTQMVLDVLERLKELPAALSRTPPKIESSIAVIEELIAQLK
jgi:hypothetical protein